jgi:hypothetical protein
MVITSLALKGEREGEREKEKGMEDERRAYVCVSVYLKVFAII